MRPLLFLIASVCLLTACDSSEPTSPENASGVWIEEAGISSVPDGLIFDAEDFGVTAPANGVIYTDNASCLDSQRTTFTLQSDSDGTRTYQSGGQTLTLHITSASITASLNGGPETRFVRLPAPRFGC